MIQKFLGFSVAMLFIVNFLQGIQFCASDGTDEPLVDDPAFMCNEQNFSQIPTLEKKYNSSDQYPAHYCDVIFLLDLDKTITSDENYSQIQQFIMETTASCMDRGVGANTYVYPMFCNDSTVKTVCCNEELCYEAFGFMNYKEYVRLYDNHDYIQQIGPDTNFLAALLNDFKDTANEEKKCLYNNYILITNRLFNLSGGSDYMQEFHNKVFPTGCITFTVIAVGVENITLDVIEVMYGNLTQNLYSVPAFNCLDNLKDCIKPCGPRSFDGCKNQEFQMCDAPTTTTTTSTTSSTPTTTTSQEQLLEEDWKVIYLFAVSNRTTSEQFSNLVKYIGEPLEECEKKNLVVQFLARNNSRSGWINEMRKAVDYLQGLKYDEVLLNSTTIIDIYDTVSLELVQNALSLDLSFDINGNTREPRISLLTDFVSQNLVENFNNYNLSLELNKYDFQIIAFNQAVADIYKSNLTISPRKIIADPGYETSKKIRMCEEKQNITVIMIIIISACGGAMLICIGFTIFYRQKHDWIKKLNRLRKNHTEDKQKKGEEEDVINHWELSWDKLIVKNERLGSGAYGQVFKGKIRGVPPAIEKYTPTEVTLYTDCDCAIKMPPKYATEAARIEFRNEIELMKTLGYNEHIVNMLGCITVSLKSCLVLEYCCDRDLLRYVKQKKNELESSKSIDDTIDGHKEFLHFLWQITRGMRFLGEKRIIHRDLAARNVLITGLPDMKNAKISDFGLAIPANSVTSNNVSCTGRLPIKWLAIECLEKESFSFKSDVWSFGIVIFEMYSLGQVPFADVEPTELINHLKKGHRPKTPLLATEKIADIMNRCWLEIPEERPNFDELGSIFAVQLEQAAEGYGYLALIKTKDYRLIVDVQPDISEIESVQPNATRQRAGTTRFLKTANNSRRTSFIINERNDEASTIRSKRKSEKFSKNLNFKASQIIPSLNALNPFSKMGKAHREGNDISSEDHDENKNKNSAVNDSHSPFARRTHFKSLKIKLSPRRGSMPY